MHHSVLTGLGEAGEKTAKPPDTKATLASKRPATGTFNRGATTQEKASDALWNRGAEGRSEQEFRLLVDSVSEYAIYTPDLDGVVTSWNPGAQRAKLYSPEEIIGKNFEIFYAEEDRTADLPKRALEVAVRDGRFNGEGWRIRKDGSRFWANVAISTIRDDGGILIGFAKVTRDISERRTNEERLYRLAHVDELTGLPNRLTLLEKLEEAVADDSPATVLLIDVDGFKTTNEWFGHKAGDIILKAAAERIRLSVDGAGTVARLGSDEFAILLSGTANASLAARLCRRLIEAFRVPTRYEDHQLYLSLSIGVSMRPAHGETADELLANADLALHQAKADGGNGYSIFEHRLREAVIARGSREGELRRALDREELELYFQPQVRLADRRIAGAEALLRWRHPTEGLLAPSAFLAILERSSIVASVGEWVIRSASAHAAVVHQLGFREYRVGVNLFSAQFRSPALVSTVIASLAEHSLPPDALELEITENIVLQHSADMIARLRELRSLGIGVAFDDYGTGYASLSLLKQYPLTRLKIDQSFVRDLCSNAEDAAVVRAIIFLAESFGLDVIAEGVETEAQEAALIALGCANGQGYRYGRPMPAQQIIAVLARQKELFLV